MVEADVNNGAVSSPPETTLPPWTKQHRRVHLVIFAVLTPSILCVGVSIFDETFPFVWIGKIFCLLTAGLLTILFFEQRRHMSARDQYESKLYQLTIQLEENNRRLQELIQLDPLTKLLNRRGLEQALEVELSRARRKKSNLYAVLVDCDNFKQINESFGHATGDVLLTTVATRMKQAVRPTDHVARVGGDEFIVFLPEITKEAAVDIGERIRLSVSANPVIHLGKDIPVTISLGIALLSEDICTIEELLILTRAALKASKDHGKNRITLSGIKISSMQIQSTIHSLTNMSTFESIKQPIIQLANKSIYGYEILSRFQEGPFALPNDFFRLAHEHGILTIVDLNCLRRAIELVQKSQNGLTYHFNIFPSTLISIPVFELDNLFKPIIDSYRICIEISDQQSLGDVNCLVKYVEYFKKQNFRVALDDIGIRRDSLDSLLILEPDIIKVNMEFVKGISESTVKQRRLQRLLSIAQSVGSELIGIGIESTDDLRTVTEMGLKYGQGFLLDAMTRFNSSEELSSSQ